MISLAAILRGLKAILGIAETARDVVDVAKEVANGLGDTQRSGSRQLSPEDVRRQQAQIARATSFKVPPYKVPQIKVPPRAKR